MLRTHIKIAFRNLWKNKFQSFILVFGLALGLMVVFFIGQYIQSERSYDAFHSKADRIYRLPLAFYKNGALDSDEAMNSAPTGPALKAEFPEVEQYVRFSPEYGRVVFQQQETQLEAQTVYYADSTLFEVFDFPLIEGNSKTALKRPFTVVLPQSTAERYFGAKENWVESPVGKTIRMNSEYDFEITGILDDIPQNSHIQFDALLSFSTFPKINNDPTNEWSWADFWTYILLKEGTNVEQFAEKLADFNERRDPFKGSEYIQYFQASSLQPLSDIHLNSNLLYEMGVNGDAKTVHFLLLIAIAILIIALANYINLATARAEERAIEVGVRKVVGADKKSLITQFLSEAFIINTLALGVAIALILIGQNSMNTLVDQTLPLPLSVGQLFLIIPIILLVGTLLSGLYPAFFLSNFSPSRVFQKENHRRGKELMRKSLVVFQYGISVALIIGTLVVYFQLEYMRDKDLGFSLDQKLILKGMPSIQDRDTYTAKYQSFKDQILALPEIEAIGGSGAVPGKNHLELDSHNGIHLASESEESGATFSSTWVDAGFLEVYDLELVAGRKFDAAIATDKDAVVLTESAVPLLGPNSPEEAIGKEIVYFKDRRIIGVVKDYHHKSLQYGYEPIIFRYFPGQFLYLSLQLNTENIASIGTVVDKVKNSWNQIYPNDPFDHFFLDDHFNAQYEAEQRLGNIALIFAAFAIFIACLGLFGLASYVITTRTKEIGIRKVLGASVTGIVALLSKDFIKLVAIAFVIATPIAYYFMNEWLQDFAYRIELQWWVFALAGLAAIGIALLTVSVQSVRAALVNPVESLRSE
ncbi:MAG: ABC transporter permease [Bacteroidota bacterium]